MTRDVGHEATLEQLATLMREAARAPVDPGLDRSGAAVVASRLEGAKPRVATRTRVVLLAAGFAALSAAVALVELRPRPLAYEVHGGSSSGSYVSVPTPGAAELSFTDGSRLSLTAGSRLRVEEEQETGARILLERGRANVSIVHRPDSSWTFAAGPFDVRVTGTRFELEWDPASEKLTLALLAGAVEVRAPFSGAPIPVRAGQRFHADMATRSMTVIDGTPTAEQGAAPGAASTAAPGTSSADDHEPATLAPGATAASSATTARRAAPVPAASTESTAAHEPWAKLVADGKFETVVRLAVERGPASCISSCTATDLRALADAARYSGHRELAMEALLALRQRFAGSVEERPAAFLLGRIEEGRGALARAETWYETYLRERPRGELAAEALAGRMRALGGTSGSSAARTVAREYLSRYPDGVHAKAARAILEAP